MFQFLSSRRGLFRLIGGAVAGLFASHVKTKPAEGAAPELAVAPPKPRAFTYDPGQLPNYLGSNVTTHVYDTSRRIDPPAGSITTITYAYCPKHKQWTGTIRLPKNPEQ